MLNHHLSRLGEVVVEGEISRLDIKNGRLIFATIKDKQSSVDIFSLSNYLHNLKELEPGMLVRITGTCGLYKGSGKFRLFASSIVPQGEGSLQIAYEKLKKQLESEGLFEPSRKRPLPPWPHIIGLITASGSSAEADLIKILHARMPSLKLKLLPVNVQGREAIPSILRAFSYLNTHPTEFDLVIMARGGGSLEDLAAFNSEELCRAVFGCPIPLISAIGHEDNWSLTDYVADLRASTPSNAAELAVRDHLSVIHDLNQSLSYFKSRLLSKLHQHLLVIQNSQDRLRHQLLAFSQIIFTALPTLKAKLLGQIVLYRQNLSHFDRLLSALDYRQTLKRGFSLTLDQSGKLIRNLNDLQPGDLLVSQLAEGYFKSRLISKERKPYA